MPLESGGFVEEAVTFHFQQVLGRVERTLQTGDVNLIALEIDVADTEIGVS